MLPRFVPALVLAVVLAAMLAGAETSAVGSQGQKPAAAAAEKQAKPPKAWPPDEATLQKRKAEAEALPLFASQEPIEITLTADWKAVQRDRNVDSKKLYPGTLSIVKDGTAGAPVPIQLRTRGHSRRDPRTCEFAPLRLELPKDGTKGTVFEGHGNLKLGVHCQSEGIYQQYMLKEYLANRLHNLLTPHSLRVRLARVTYADSRPGRKPETRLGLFFEDIDDLAKRMQARELSVPRQMFKYVEPQQLMLMSMFQYMIANTDYSILALHNVIMLDDAKGVRLTVAYDFDYSGLVNTHYAIPFKGLMLSSVRERRWRGPCKTEAEVEQALTPFLEKKADLLALPSTLAALGLEAGHIRSTEKYLNEFFEIIENPNKRKKAFVTECTTGEGM